MRRVETTNNVKNITNDYYSMTWSINAWHKRFIRLESKHPTQKKILTMTNDKKKIMQKVIDF